MITEYILPTDQAFMDVLTGRITLHDMRRWIIEGQYETGQDQSPFHIMRDIHASL